MSTKKLASEAGRALSRMRKTHAGGAPAKLSPCKYCGELLGARARRVHEPRCPKKPAKASKAVPPRK